ncbi:Crp/Fnr family transcriptional regulator [Geofilum rubicundum]|uniref:Transcriptional regulator, Crp/Fnr family n=1 Tax=Geofilum rubicundum JCM 15548 TaxID=1236989 RepID=A0A0E9M0Z9_9BACT|nr:Crp/Fnr family transcriptional regulator [Geofilum rubicundum]GAO31228.1 transcriptional regulator, Crp/Fnr family [Geofilum rubicundum JCM 15548]
MKTIQENDHEFICDIDAPCFHMLVGEELDLVRESKTQVLFRKGENLTKQGTFASYILFIIKGVVKQHLEEGDKNYNLRLIKPGEFVGLSTVFGKNTYNYSTIALTDTQTLLIEKSAIEQLTRNNGQFAFNLIQRYCEQSAMLYGSIRNLMYKQMNGRLADALLYLSGEEWGTYDVFTLLSRKDLSDFAGISTESTVKLLKALEKDGIIQLNDKNIAILNRPVLQEIAEKG